MPPHCDTLDGPVVKAARLALETRDVNLILPYVPKEGEAEVIRTFDKVLPLRNNGRVLPTQFFDSPILSVVAKPIEGPSQSVNVEIRLRRKVPYNVTQNDRTVALDFTRESLDRAKKRLGDRL